MQGDANAKEGAGGRQQIRPLDITVVCQHYPVCVTKGVWQAGKVKAKETNRRECMDATSRSNKCTVECEPRVQVGVLVHLFG